MRSRKACHDSPEETYSIRLPRVGPLNDIGLKTTKVETNAHVMRVGHISLRNMLRMRESKEDRARRGHIGSVPPYTLRHAIVTEFRSRAAARLQIQGLVRGLFDGTCLASLKLCESWCLVTFGTIRCPFRCCTASSSHMCLLSPKFKLTLSSTSTGGYYRTVNSYTLH